MKYNLCLFAFFCVFNVLLAEEKANSLEFVRDFVVEQKLLGDKSGKIFTVQDQMKKNRGVFRRPPGSQTRGTKWMAVDLVYVAPGGLEAKSEKYSMSLENELGVKYQAGSFSFSGRADALVYYYRVGWGVENNNGDFTPILLHQSYEDVEEPTYDIVWSRRIGGEGRGREGRHEGEGSRRRDRDFGDQIYLDYLIKVPKKSKIQWGREMGITRENFAGRFSSNSPKIRENSVWRWRRGLFQLFSSNLNRPPKAMKYKLPFGYKLTSFCLFENGSKIATATAEKQVGSFDLKVESLWTNSGRSPIIVHENDLIAISSDYLSINFHNLKNGEIKSKTELPKHLPRTGNSVCVFSAGGESFLLLVIPEQSRILCYKFK